jgi:Tfp pilus assembly protein PilV
MKPRPRRLLAQAGFGLVDVLVAMTILLVGTLAWVSTFDRSRDLTTVSERQQAATDIGERELERMISLSYAKVATSNTPVASADTSNPASYLRNCSGLLCFAWNRGDAASAERVVVDASAPEPYQETWNTGRLSGRLYRFVTLVDDPCTGCPSAADQAITADYKRVVVAVTVNGSAAPRRPLLLSALVANPAAKAGP